MSKGIQEIPNGYNLVNSVLRQFLANGPRLPQELTQRSLLTFLLFCRHPPVLEKEKVGQAVNVYR